MRLWMQSYAHGTVFSPSVALSVAAHVVIFGAAAYGAGPRASRSDADLVEERVYYLPPPDRVKASSTIEQLRYVSVGNGIPTEGIESADGTPAGAPRHEDAAPPGGTAGTDLKEHPAQAPSAADDSVYSILSIEESAVRVEESAAPIYPPELVEQHVEGSVPTRYVIDTTGRADTSTVEIMAPAHPLFVQSVREALAGMRFSPAIVQGRKVRQLVEQRFDFRIVAPPPGAPAEHTRARPVP